MDTFLLVTNADDPVIGIRAFSSMQAAMAAMTDIFGELKETSCEAGREGTWSRFCEMDFDAKFGDDEWTAEIHTVTIES